MKNLRLIVLGLSSILVAACGNQIEKTKTAIPVNPAKVQGLPKVEDFQAVANKFGASLSLPKFEDSPAEIESVTKSTLEASEVALKEMSTRSRAEMTFENSIRKMDDVLLDAGNLLARLDLIKETSTKADVRDAAASAEVELRQWFTGLDYREDLYQMTKDFQNLNPNLQEKRPDLNAESLKYFDDLARGYRRSGMGLEPEKRKEVESLRKQMDEIETQFQQNITEDKTTVEFTAEELTGVPEELFSLYKKNPANGKFIVSARSPSQAVPILENAKQEETRKRMITARYQVAMTTNAPLLEKAVANRDKIAKLLGYKTWADYRIEIKMAKNVETAEKLLVRVAQGLDPKMKKEVEEMLTLKRRDVGNAQTEFQIWDYYYYMNQLQKERYSVDPEALKVFFKSDNVLQGMFKVFGLAFQLKFTQVEAPFKWVDDLQLFLVQDSKTDEPLGLVYFDLFPREGKYNHFAQFGITSGKLLSNGVYQRPVVAVVCNFPPATENAPSLLSFDDVETMFHEFGHALHSVLTRAEYASYSGTSVQADFVEAPSQMLENWVSQKDVLDVFAVDYRDPSKKIDQSFLDKIRDSKLGVAGVYE